MPERINKLQPDRTLQLRGFDTFAAAASLHSASPDGFTASGTFRDPADFAVAVLYDADDYFEHPLIKYLPDFDFSGLTLSFNLNYADGLQPIDSPKYNWVDWATLNCIRADGTTALVSLWANAMLVDPVFPAASATCSIIAAASGIQALDRVTLWFQDLAFDYSVPGSSKVQFSFHVAGAGTVHSITVNGAIYNYTETGGAGLPQETDADVAAGLIAAIDGAGDPDVIASAGAASNAVQLTVQTAKAGIDIAVSASDGNGDVTLFLTTPMLVAAQIVAAINGTNWIAANTTHALLASSGPVSGNAAAITLTAARYGAVNVSGAVVTWVSGAPFPGLTAGLPMLIDGSSYTVASIQSPTQLTLTTAPAEGSGLAYVAPRGGHDGNLIQLYTTSSTSTLAFDQTRIQLSGGSSAVRWNCSLDFTALGIDQVRQLWLTFAPSLTTGTYASTEWQAVFSNWQLSGTGSAALSVAGPGSVRIEEDDPACVYQGSWTVDSAFYSGYFAMFTSDPAASVTVTYISQFTHDLYIGTSLYTDRGVAGIRLDGDAETSLNCYLATDTAVVTRRRVRTAVPAGSHSVVIRLQQAGLLYFDFLEAAVLTDVPDPLAPRIGISPALDFDTDHSYKLPPARIVWMLNRMGYAGPVNEYLGVFWWNERVLSGGSVSTAEITFSGTFAEGDSIIVTLNETTTSAGTTLTKSVLQTDTLTTIAYHFAAWINSSLVGAWASANQSILTITGRSPAPAYNLTVSISVTSANGQAAITRQPQAGVYGTWIVDDAATPPLNRAARDWHSDFYAQCASQSLQVTTACSMELVNPPAGYVAVFPGEAATPVSTATGFGTLVSNHCAIGGSKMLAYQKSVYRSIAQLQVAAGLTPSVQYGEFLWWYFPVAQNVAIGYASFTTPISIGTNVPHGLSTGVMVTTAGVLGNTAANGTFTITVTDATHFTLNGTTGNGNYTGGGSVTGGGMAFYDAETAAAARAALGRDLHVFYTSNDDPGVNGGADVLFLRNRLRDHVATLVSDIRSVYSNVKCEVLWPYDVNYPTPVPAGDPIMGGQLNYAVNLPVEWQSQPASGLDTMKVEALAFSSGLRNLDLSQDAVDLFPAFGWPGSALRYLLPVFGSATPWYRELSLAIGAGIPTNNLWALDHVCLFNLAVPEPSLERRSLLIGG